jgi:NuA3 HAT complex component NTO1
VGSWPYFPAEIIDENLDDETDPIPKTLLDRREELARNNAANGGRVWLVRFFDKQNSYGWIPASRLDLLSSDDCEL